MKNIYFTFIIIVSCTIQKSKVVNYDQNFANLNDNFEILIRYTNYYQTLDSLFILKFELGIKNKRNDSILELNITRIQDAINVEFMINDKFYPGPDYGFFKPEQYLKDSIVCIKPGKSHNFLYSTKKINSIKRLRESKTQLRFSYINITKNNFSNGMIISDWFNLKI